MSTNQDTERFDAALSHADPADLQHLTPGEIRDLKDIYVTDCLIDEVSKWAADAGCTRRIMRMSGSIDRNRGIVICHESDEDSILRDQLPLSMGQTIALLAGSTSEYGTNWAKTFIFLEMTRDTHTPFQFVDYMLRVTRTDALRSDPPVQLTNPRVYVPVDNMLEFGMEAVQRLNATVDYSNGDVIVFWPAIGKITVSGGAEYCM